jgi:DNA-binding transcriptional MocR family regulator
MSIQAMNWARKIVTGSASRKTVLMALANYAGESGEAYPSIETICRDTELNRKTVMVVLANLASAGLIEDTGRRVGTTNSVRVWALSMDIEAVPKLEQSQNRSSPDFVIEAVPILDKKQYQNRYLEPSGEQGIGTSVLDTLGSRYRPRARGAETGRQESAPERRAREAREAAEDYFGAADREEERRIRALNNQRRMMQ